ncbi:Branched-chain amino acid transport protein [Lentilactobacillus farraginis DSM 18382 = JCM 14108]|uniref:Branched-chain amino acid transport protein n=1 Tax=Lentilactobacillus farraginis DSM 18382 = JCM 14108 TaxID=1423743 RepID=A0A0R1VZN5_9LACO|nr:Branched-chain amino acid transport protein [Lentilactobacillus farraginis DSM 18382 = JCM 14108]
MGSGIATWLSRIMPFVILKKFKLSAGVIEFLSFVPIAIMSALWFENLFIQHLGHLPSLNVPNLIASLPTILSAIISKSLLVTVVVGVISLAFLRLVLGM